MEFTLEEAFDLIVELIMMSGLIGVLIYYFTKMHTFG